ncbi:hypothetical protein [Planomicrobium okeanokoites]|uniref:hypothetical protein n=1 Tax=Planomicrobium okeanokoites TaxID=244 RepID=UPI000A05AD30|nr:hypothetical protein [Planomicrobium okeanokoites]
MTYLKKLDSADKEYKKIIHDLVEKYKIQFLSSRYNELITPSESVLEFIADLTRYGIAIDLVAWWCHCTEENESKYGCPHGMGGPQSEYSDSWFSEMQIQAFEVTPERLSEFNKNPDVEKIEEINNSVITAITSIVDNDEYSPCLVPALGLFVPQDWDSMKWNLKEF